MIPYEQSANVDYVTAQFARDSVAEQWLKWFMSLSWPKQAMLVATAIWVSLLSASAVFQAFFVATQLGTDRIGESVVFAFIVWLTTFGLLSIPYGIAMIVLSVANAVVPARNR